MEEAIPKSVLELLSKRWRTTDGYSAFDSVFTGARGEERRLDPSYYHVRTDWQGPLDTFTYQEIATLNADNALGPFVTDHGTSVAVNEHAQHALADFCSEVYDAWKKYQERLQAIPLVGRRTG